MRDYFDGALKAKTRKERIDTIGFVRELVEDLTNMKIESVKYLNNESYHIKFLNKQHKDLNINVHMDSLSAITYDVINQTEAYLRE